MNYRNRAGRFVSNWYQSWTTENKILVPFMFALVLFIGGHHVWVKIQPKTLVYVATRAYAMEAGPDRLEGKIDELKGEVLDTLAKCESGGKSPDSGVLTWDTNNQHSIGIYQFQIKTVQHYAKVLWKKELTGREAIMLALDPVEARKLAHDVIFTTDRGSASDWVICSRNYGLQEKVDIIKSLDD